MIEIWNDCPVCGAGLTNIDKDNLPLLMKALRCMVCLSYTIVFEQAATPNGAIDWVKISFDVISNQEHQIYRFKNRSIIEKASFAGIEINYVLSVKDCLNKNKINTYILFS